MHSRNNTKLLSETAKRKAEGLRRLSAAFAAAEKAGTVRYISAANSQA